MPILYTCVLNKRSEVVIEGQYASRQQSYKTQVLKLSDRFEYLQIKSILLNEEEQLYCFYMHKDSLILVCIGEAVDSLEMGNFLDKIYVVCQHFYDEWVK